ncbi:endonuclease/exonuclease/phosphatase family protein [Gorillibacterium sp. CAU 1737]|uniref:endonuclease/exonuclease/phosphatase family protein n=1 Tax=Gorillibacterium sp. CAU 1737 TaxID=3140362 RepID=UPI003261B515
MRLKVATFNIQHGRGMDGRIVLDRIAAEIARMKADVVALQEVDRFHPRSYLHDQLRRLGRRLGRRTAFAPSINFGLVQYGNGLLTRYPILSKQVIYLQGINERRSILSVKVQTPSGPCTFVNVHLGLLERERELQFPYVLQALDSIDGKGVLLGDFNMEADHPLLDKLSPKWVKVAANPLMPTVRSGREIDHIYVNDLPKHSKVYVQTTDASDHHAVVAALDW